MQPDNTAILQKTRELCQTILDEPEFASIRFRLDSFMNDEAARAQFDAVNQKGMELQTKQQKGVPLTDAEIGDFEKDRDALLNNAVARDFLAAQQEMNHIKGTVTRYVSRTFELGRVPGAEDFESCGSGCSCH